MEGVGTGDWGERGGGGGGGAGWGIGSYDRRGSGQGNSGKVRALVVCSYWA